MANTTNFGIETPTVGGYRNTWGGTINTGLSRIDELLALALPIGTIQMYTKSTAPTATTNGGTWLVCNGGTLQRSDYPDLHALITNTYGTYPSGSTFVLPDMRTRVPVGFSADTVGSGPTQRTPKAIAAGTGEETHILSEAELAKHTHPITDAGHPHNTTESAHTHTGTTGKAKSDVILNNHAHTGQKWTDYQGDTSGAGQLVGSFYFNPRRLDNPYTTDEFSGTSLLKEDGVDNNGHQHSFTTGGTETELTIDSATTGITVNEQGTGDTAHNNMQPYLVVNYIILAKHPSF